MGSTEDYGIEEARKRLGPIANRAHLAGEITYLTRNGTRIAAIVPLDRIKETAMATTYTRSTDEGVESVEILRDGEEVREVYTVDGDVCDDSILCDRDADEYLHRRDAELRSEGYVSA